MRRYIRRFFRTPLGRRDRAELHGPRTRRPEVRSRVPADLQPMAVAPRAPGEYAPLAGGRAVEALQDARRPCAVFASSTSGPPGSRAGPRAARRVLPLAAGAGLARRVARALRRPELRRVGMALQRRAPRGRDRHLARGLGGLDRRDCERIGRSLNGTADLVVLHDPGTPASPPASVPVTWRCHLDASRPEPPRARRVSRPLLEPLLARARADASFAPDALRGGRLQAAPPGIDPLAPRNLDLEPRLAGRVVRQLGVDLDSRSCCQVMRLDRWKDPHAARGVPPRGARSSELQLVLAGRSTRATPTLARGQGGRPTTRGPGRLLLLTSYRAWQPGARRAAAARAVALQRRCARASVWRLRGALEAHAGRGAADGGVPLQVRDGIDGYLTADPRGDRRADRGAGPRPRPRRSRWAGRAASACASASSSRARSSTSCALLLRTGPRGSVR